MWDHRQRKKRKEDYFSVLGDAYMIMLTAAKFMAARHETLKCNTS